MNKVFQFKWSLTTIILFVTAIGFGQVTSSKKLTKTFAITEAGQVTINNKYGNVSVSGWDKDSVKVKVEIITEGTSDELIKRINPTFDYSEEYLEVTSEISPKKESYFGRLMRTWYPAVFDKSSVDIHYQVFIPAKAQLKVDNKYGDINIEDCKGRLRLRAEHGDIRSSGYINYADVNLTFGLFRVHTIGRADITIRSGTIDITQADHIELKSVGSEIEIDSVKTLTIDVNKGRTFINSVDILNAETRFAEMDVELIEEFADIDAHQSEISLVNLGGELQKVILNQTSSDIEIQSFERGLDVYAYLESGLLRLPRSASDLDVKIINEKEEIREVTATIGTSPYTNLQIKGKKGIVIIK